MSGIKTQNGEIFKKSIGSDVENGPRVYVTYSAYGYSEETERKLYEEMERFWKNVKEIIKNSAGGSPAE